MTFPQTHPVRPWISTLAGTLLPLALNSAAFYLLAPVLEDLGWPAAWAYAAALALAGLILLAAVVWAVRAEGIDLTWAGLSRRLRLARMDWRTWAWALGLLLWIGFLYSLLAYASRSWLDAGWLPLPDRLPAFQDPRLTAAPAALRQMLGGASLPGFLLFSLLMLLPPLAGELWWRGLLLPRQEDLWRGWGWLLNAGLFLLAQGYQYWNLPALLAAGLGLAYAARELKNTLPGLLAYTAFNALGLIAVGMAILK